MLSNVSGFTQSSAADDDAPSVPPSTGAAVGAATVAAANGAARGSHGYPHTGTTLASLRGPPGFTFPRARGSSGSGSAFGSGSGSSIHSGSGGGSAKDPTSPV